MENFSIWDRLKSETPKFWRKIGAIGGSFVGIGTALGIAVDKYKIDWFPDHIPGYLIVAGTVMLGLAPLAVKNPPSPPKPDDNEVN